jgi:hypothetical protein
MCEWLLNECGADPNGITKVMAKRKKTIGKKIKTLLLCVVFL